MADSDTLSASGPKVNAVDSADSRHLYLQVRDFIREHVKRNGLQVGDQLPTNRQLAEITNVSQLTVNKAVGSLIREGALSARRGRGTFVRNPHAAITSKPKTGTYATVVPTIEANTVAAFISALDDLVFAKSGHHMFVCNNQLDLDREIAFLDSLLDRAVDALIYQLNPRLCRLPVFLKAIDVRLGRFLAAGIPVVMIDRFARPDRYDTVEPDKSMMAEAQIRHLLDLGHTRLLFVGYTDISYGILDGWHKAIQKFGLQKDQVRMALTDEEHIDVGVEKEMKKVLDDGWPFTAIVAASDYFGMSCHNFLKSHDISCPRDVSIVGADNLEGILHTDIHLTTVWCEPYNVARAVAELIDRRMGQAELPNVEPEHIQIAPKIAVRQSTARPVSVIAPQTNSKGREVIGM